MALTQVQVPVYFCPSDRRGMWKGDGCYRSRGNYVLNWGAADLCQNTTTYPNYKRSPFGPNRTSRLSEITDGTSNTLLMSEAIQARVDGDFDWRGDIHNDDTGCAQFMTLNTPNTGIDRTACVNLLDPSPCIYANPHYMSARSSHSGGVNSLFADGSVRFLSNYIDLNTWQSLGSMEGGEAINQAAY